jgi:hypothetical protein
MRSDSVWERPRGAVTAVRGVGRFVRYLVIMLFAPMTQGALMPGRKPVDALLQRAVLVYPELR